MQGKIIGVGFQKTGTSTLREALKLLGYRVKDTTPRALIPILRNNYKKVLRILKGYDALEDTPWFYIYKELDLYIPGSKFILTVRDEDSWYRSVSRHIGDLRAAHHEWIYGRGMGIPAENEENTRKVYREHNQEVRAYFKSREDDFLELDFTRGDGWEKLCAFLGHEVPDIPFPHYNKTPDKIQENWRFKFRRWRHRTKNQLKIHFISLMGWW